MKVIESFKICDGFKVVWFGGQRDFEDIGGVWDLFGWDVDNDEKALECARKVNRELFACGYCDIRNSNGTLIRVEVIPCKEA